MEFYFVMIKKGISSKDIVALCHLLSMYNLQPIGLTSSVKIWLTDDERIEKLAKMLNILDVKYVIYKGEALLRSDD